jgi:hypothetical protein
LVDRGDAIAAQADGDVPGWDDEAALRESGTQRFRYQLSQQQCSLNSIGERPLVAQKRTLKRKRRFMTGSERTENYPNF